MRSLPALTRYELYRLAHTRKTWVYLIVCLLIAGSPATSGELFRPLTVNVTVVASLFAGHVAADEFTSGHAKNVLRGSHARGSYAGAMLLALLAATVVFTVLSALCFSVWMTLAHEAGDAPMFASAGTCLSWLARPSTWLWLGAVAFFVFVHVCETLVVAVATGNAALAVVAGYLVGTGLPEMLLMSSLQDGPLGGAIRSLQVQGAFPLLSFHGGLGAGEAFAGPLPLAAGAAVVALCASLAIVALRRKDVSAHAG